METIILEVHRKEENLTENHATPTVSEIYTNKSINEENSSLFNVHEYALCRMAKTRVETSSLRNINIMPRNLNEIVLI
jgi:hypothetical protein